VNGLVRYWGPENGGINDDSKAEYRASLQKIIASKSVRFFLDTFLSHKNIAMLLGADAPELPKLKQEWYCFKILGCMQENSSFPIYVHIKKQEFWASEPLEDGILKTMKENMTNKPVQVNDHQETPRGKRISDRKKTETIDFHCGKTYGCVFVSKSKQTMKKHERKCRPKPVELVCRVKGCKFTTLYKAGLSNHVKTCTGDAVVVSSEAVEEKVAAPQKVFACTHPGCNKTHATKKGIAAHQRTHEAIATSPPKPNPPGTSRSKGANTKPPVPTGSVPDADQSDQSGDAKKNPRANKRKRVSSTKPPPKKNKNSALDQVITLDDSEPDAEQSDQGTESDDAKKNPRANKTNRGSSTKPQTKKKPDSTLGSSQLSLVTTKLYKCPFASCDKSHATPELAQRHQRKHLEGSASLQGAHSEIYRCPECPLSHLSAETARLHQQEHRSLQQRPRPGDEVHPLTLCYECKLFSGTDKQVLAHIGACRAALSCPQCGVKCDTTPHLIAHIFRCSQTNVMGDKNNVMGGQKRERDYALEDEQRWKPDRNRNNKNDVKLHWRGSHVKDWLVLVELEEYGASFIKEKVDGRVLLELTAEAIKAYGMKETHAKKFLELRAAFH
jgi:hypothetical protein